MVDARKRCSSKSFNNSTCTIEPAKWYRGQTVFNTELMIGEPTVVQSGIVGKRVESR